MMLTECDKSQADDEVAPWLAELDGISKQADQPLVDSCLLRHPDRVAILAEFNGTPQARKAGSALAFRCSESLSEIGTGRVECADLYPLRFDGELLQQPYRSHLQRRTAVFCGYRFAPPCSESHDETVSWLEPRIEALADRVRGGLLSTSQAVSRFLLLGRFSNPESPQGSWELLWVDCWEDADGAADWLMDRAHGLSQFRKAWREELGGELDFWGYDADWRGGSASDPAVDTDRRIGGDRSVVEAPRDALDSSSSAAELESGSTIDPDRAVRLVTEFITTELARQGAGPSVLDAWLVSGLILSEAYRTVAWLRRSGGAAIDLALLSPQLDSVWQIAQPVETRWLQQLVANDARSPVSELPIDADHAERLVAYAIRHEVDPDVLLSREQIVAAKAAAAQAVQQLGSDRVVSIHASLGESVHVRTEMSHERLVALGEQDRYWKSNNPTRVYLRGFPESDFLSGSAAEGTVLKLVDAMNRGDADAMQQALTGEFRAVVGDVEQNRNVFVKERLELGDQDASGSSYLYLGITQLGSSGDQVVALAYHEIRESEGVGRIDQWPPRSRPFGIVVDVANGEVAGWHMYPDPVDAVDAALSVRRNRVALPPPE